LHAKPCLVGLAAEIKKTVKLSTEPSFLATITQPTAESKESSFACREHVEGLRRIGFWPWIAPLHRLVWLTYHGVPAPLTWEIGTEVDLQCCRICAPVWCRNAHTKKLKAALNDRLRINSGCLKLGVPSSVPLHFPSKPIQGTLYLQA